MNIKVDDSKVERHSLFESKISTNLPGTVAPWCRYFGRLALVFKDAQTTSWLKVMNRAVGNLNKIAQIRAWKVSQIYAYVTHS